jgi:hypothetical protein
MEHRKIPDWPDALGDFAVTIAANKNRQPFVYPCRHPGIPSRAKDRRSAGIRIDEREVVRFQREATFRISKIIFAAEEKSALRVASVPFSAGSDKNAEF